MPSRALKTWRGSSAKALDEIEAAHAAIGGLKPGRRYATEQINHAYVVMLCSQFQRFCRDLHSEASDFLVTVVSHTTAQHILRVRLSADRKLDAGNPNPGNIGSDFNRFSFALWPALDRRNLQNVVRRASLDSLNKWRNAIAHQDFVGLQWRGRNRLRLDDVRLWRSTCNALARDLDSVVGDELAIIVGKAPW